MPLLAWVREGGKRSGQNLLHSVSGAYLPFVPYGRLSQGALIAHTPRETFAIESFEKWHHDASRTFQGLSEFTHCGRTVFGNEISDCIFHAFKVLAQQHDVRGEFSHFSALNQEFENSLLLQVPLKLSARRWIERFLA